VFDVGAPELLLLVVIAVILFGPEKLPEFARKAARLLRYVRTMAGNAQQQLSQELGTDVDLRDLNPKAFVQKHLLDDVEPIVADVKKEITAATAIGGAAAREVTSAIESATTPASALNGASAIPAARLVTTPFDPDAT
jgi:sec-independent protein translocase protein TatB